MMDWIKNEGLRNYPFYEEVIQKQIVLWWHRSDNYFRKMSGLTTQGFPASLCSSYRNTYVTDMCIILRSHKIMCNHILFKYLKGT